MEERFGVILAGGSGTRFWPLSREKMPKQFLSILGDRSMLALTIDRALALTTAERIWIVTVRSQKDEVERELCDLGLQKRVKVLEEPAGKNTAAAIGLAAVHILRDDPEGVMAVFPSDHYIGNPSAFLKILKFGCEAACRDWMVTLGIRPTHPETAYGYIEKGEPLDFEKSELEIFSAARFTEKPNRSTAEDYLASGRFFWNGGIFIWKANRFMAEMKTHLPDHFEKLRKMEKIPDQPDRCDTLYAALESISVDYGILERSDRVAVIPTEVGWSDVGSWAALYDLLEKDQNLNALSGDVIALDSRNSLIRSEERLLAAVGIDNLVIVETTDAVLVCRKDRSQDVRAVAQRLLNDGRPEAVIRPLVLKPWGAYKSLDQGKGYQVKWLDIRPGQRLSLQSHQQRSEHWTVVSGKATVTVDDRTFELTAGEDVYIPRQSKHRIANRSEELLRIIEVQTGSYLGEDDIVRYEDDYGRTE
jgi:mannose-1-phosphate guanylyltransferase / mannose-6-phosphate isomerase